MAERKTEISISSPEFFSYSRNLGLIVHFYEEMLEEEKFPLYLLGVMGSLELLQDSIPEEVFEFYTYCIEMAANKRVIIDVDGTRTPIPPFDPDDPMCRDCHELVDIALTQYAFIASVKGESNPLSDYLGGVFAYSGIAFEGIEDGYHLKSEETQDIYKQLYASLAPNKEARIAYKERLLQRLRQLTQIFEGA